MTRIRQDAPRVCLSARAAFTLVELLVAFAVLSVILVILVSITDQTQRVIKKTNQRIDAFRSARTGFEMITRRLGQATLNTYWDYDDPSNPTRYVRQSELRFSSGPIAAAALTVADPHPTHGIFFQAPLGFVEDDQLKGLDSLLNTWGIHIEYGEDTFRPDFLGTTGSVPPRKRLRLVEMMEPSEDLTLFTKTSGDPAYGGNEWFTTPAARSINSHVVAENIIALILLPKLPDKDVTSGNPDLSLTTDYNYSSAPTVWPPEIPQPVSEHQLPPIVRVTMVALDEASARRLEELSQGDSVSWLGLNNLFRDPLKFSSGDLQAALDLETLQSKLISHNLAFRVFTTEVGLRAAKWSSK